VHEDVRDEVRVGEDEVRRGAREGDEAAVGGDRGGGAVLVPLDAEGIDADALGRAGEAVADEDVEGGVRVGRDEVRRGAREGDEAAVGGDRGLAGASAVGLGACGIEADAPRDLRGGGSDEEYRADERRHTASAGDEGANHGRGSSGRRIRGGPILPPAAAARDARLDPLREVHAAQARLARREAGRAVGEALEVPEIGGDDRGFRAGP
jgi:hypothetical protein